MSIAVYVHVGVKVEDNDDSSYTITHVPNPTFFASLGRTTLAHSLFFPPEDCGADRVGVNKKDDHCFSTPCTSL